jgi:sec-independent protein translocase protein TatC
MRSQGLDEKAQSLYDHLGELRKRLVNCLLILFVATGICYGFSDTIFDFVRAPIVPYLPDGGLIFTGPMDKFIAHLKLSVVCGIILSCPLWLHQVWLFVAPGLYAKEKKYALGFIFSGSVLFILGTAFSYYIALPMAFQFLMTFGGTVDKPMISIEAYMGFFTQLCLMFGAAFELPLIIVLLGMMGIVSQSFLRKNRRYAVMTLAVLSAIITPPDILSMALMLVPMWFLFEVAVLIVGFFEKKRDSADLSDSLDRANQRE